MSLLRPCEYCTFHQVTYCLDLMHSPCLQGGPCAAQQGGLRGGEGRRRDFSPRRKERFLGVRLCIYVLFECKPLVGAA